MLVTFFMPLTIDKLQKNRICIITELTYTHSHESEEISIEVGVADEILISSDIKSDLVRFFYFQNFQN